MAQCDCRIIGHGVERPPQPPKPTPPAPPEPPPPRPPRRDRDGGSRRLRPVSGSGREAGERQSSLFGYYPTGGVGLIVLILIILRIPVQSEHPFQ